MPVADAISTRQLSRSLLARQLLLERRTSTPLAIVEHLVGLQAQVPTSPHIALWSRLDAFRIDELAPCWIGGASSGSR